MDSLTLSGLDSSTDAAVVVAMSGLVEAGDSSLEVDDLNRVSRTNAAVAIINQASMIKLYSEIPNRRALAVLTDVPLTTMQSLPLPVTFS